MINKCLLIDITTAIIYSLLFNINYLLLSAARAVCYPSSLHLGCLTLGRWRKLAM